MEESSYYRNGSKSSFRIESSSIWRSDDVEVFSNNSFHQEDDEEALKWAAIQKLPTVSRLRKGLLTSPDGEASEIDIQKLGYQERKNLLERLMRIAEEDNEKFLLKLRNRIDRWESNMSFLHFSFSNNAIRYIYFVSQIVAF